PAVSGLRMVLAALPELPGRAVSCYGVLLELGDRLIAHAGEVIVRMIVLAHVIEAEVPVFALAQPAFGSAVRCRAGAARPVAARAIGARPTLLTGLDPDAVEYGRVEFHDRSLCGLPHLGCKLSRQAAVNSLLPLQPSLTQRCGPA